MPKPPRPETPPPPDALNRALLSTAALLLALPVSLFSLRATHDNPGSRPAAHALHRININTASAETLRLLRGVGPSLAERIVNDRAEHGPYTRADDLQRVTGIGAQLPSRWAAHITFDHAADEIEHRHGAE